MSPNESSPVTQRPKRGKSDGKQIAIIGDEDTVIGFGLTGIKYLTTVTSDFDKSELILTIKGHIKNDEIGFVVSDRENAGLMKILLEDYENLKALGTEYKKMKNIIDTIFFAPSYTCANLQLVDFCAYSIFRHFERGISDRFTQIQPKFDPFGLKKFP